MKEKRKIKKTARYLRAVFLCNCEERSSAVLFFIHYVFPCLQLKRFFSIERKMQS
jgi:hypothetical protein